MSEASGTLAAGAAAPDFTLTAQPGADVSLVSLRGRPVVLFFYPKDNTPGCTMEACDFRDRFDALAALGAQVFGVSRDSLRAHEGFRKKFNLPYPLLVDADAAVHMRYGAWGDKVLYGKHSIGALRTTVLIDADGKVVQIWSRVRVKDHAAAVLAAVEALVAAPG